MLFRIHITCLSGCDYDFLSCKRGEILSLRVTEWVRALSGSRSFPSSLFPVAAAEVIMHPEQQRNKLLLGLFSANGSHFPGWALPFHNYRTLAHVLSTSENAIPIYVTWRILTLQELAQV